MLRRIRASAVDWAGERILATKLACCFRALIFNSILPFEKVLPLNSLAFLYQPNPNIRI